MEKELVGDFVDSEFDGRDIIGIDRAAAVFTEAHLHNSSFRVG